MYVDFIEPCFGIGHNLSLICQMTSEDIKHQLIIDTMHTHTIQVADIGMLQMNKAIAKPYVEENILKTFLIKTVWFVVTASLRRVGLG